MTALHARPAAGDDLQAPRPSLWPSVVVGAAFLLGQALVLADVDVVVLRPVVALAVLIGLPVLVLVRRVSWSAESACHRLVYAVAATVLGLMLVALALNTVGPMIGWDRPLDRIVVATTSTVVGLALIAWRPRVALLPDRRTAVAALRPLWSVRVPWAGLVGAGALVLAVAGAVRLNNAESGAVAIAAHWAVVVAVALLLVQRGTLARDASVVWLASLALLLGTSLRGWFVTGHDVQREYAAFLLTNGAAHWDMDVYRSAYNACVSVTMLPTVLAQTTGLPGPVVFKLLLPAVISLLPVVLLLAARRWLTPRLSVVGVLLFLAYPTFAVDLPYLLRQGVAYLFLATALLAASESTWSVRRRRIVVGVLGVGVVLSHYSTTYLLIIALGLALAGVLGERLIALLRGRARRPDRLVLIHPLVVLGLALTTWAWTGPATQSGGHLHETIDETVNAVMGGGAGPGSSDLGYGLLAGAQASPQERLDDYAEQVDRTRSEDAAGDRLLSPADYPAPRALEPRLSSPTELGRTLDAAGVPVEKVNSTIRLAAAVAFQLFLLVGTAALVLRRRHRLRSGAEARWIVIGALGSLATVVVVPGLSAEYGVLRAFQQVLVLTLPVVVLGAVTVFSVLRSWAAPAAAAAGVGMAASLTGALPGLLGGAQPMLSQGDVGQYHDLYYVTAPEVAAAEWLAATDDGQVQSEVISDKVAVGRLQNMVPSRFSVVDEFYPGLLRPDAYVFLPAETAEHDRATVFFTGDLLTYRYPTALLDDDLSRVYDSGAARIYR